MSSVVGEIDLDLLFALFKVEVQLCAVIRNRCPRRANFALLGANAFAAPHFRIRNRARKVLLFFMSPNIGKNIPSKWRDADKP